MNLFDSIFVYMKFLERMSNVKESQGEKNKQKASLNNQLDHLKEEKKEEGKVNKEMLERQFQKKKVNENLPKKSPEDGRQPKAHKSKRDSKPPIGMSPIPYSSRSFLKMLFKKSSNLFNSGNNPFVGVQVWKLLVRGFT